ncbi:hypothetical protein JYT20_00085 [Rhodothermus sp. AH-315-K08]|nr:hypothetical protein [Rhodothermus sp. AH-315-K08]
MTKLNALFSSMLLAVVLVGSFSAKDAQAAPECYIDVCDANGCYGYWDYCIYIICPDGPDWCMENIG